MANLLSWTIGYEDAGNSWVGHGFVPESHVFRGLSKLVAKKMLRNRQVITMSCPERGWQGGQIGPAVRRNQNKKKAGQVGR